MEKANGYYFIAAGSLLYQAEDAADEVEWTATYPDGAASYLCYHTFLSGNTLYAVFYSTDAETFLFVSADVSAPATGITWSDNITLANLTDSSAEVIVDMDIADDLVFILTNNDRTYSLYTAVLSGFSASSALETISSSITTSGELQANSDGSGTYWAVVGNKVFTGDGTASGTSDIASTIETAVSSSYLFGNGYNGVICVDTDVYITTEEGVMLRRTGGTWSTMDSPYDTDTGCYESLYSLSRFTYSTTIDIVLAASAQGYYELDLNSTDDLTFINPKKVDTNLTEYIQYDAIDLSDSVINGFFIDSTTTDVQPRVYALGYSAGLWINHLNDENERFWDIE